MRIDDGYASRPSCDTDRLAGERAARITYSAALRELRHVVRLEQARLLRQASTLREGRDDRGAAGDSRRPAAQVKAWRRDALAETDCGRGLPGNRMIAQLLSLPLEEWPTSSEIARAALALDEGDASRLRLACAHAHEGRVRAAIGGLTQLLADGPVQEARGPAMEALAAALLGEGDERAALEWIDAAAREPRSSLESVVGVLALALRQGDELRARDAAARLACVDLRSPGIARRLRGSLRRWTVRIRARATFEDDEGSGHGARGNRGALLRSASGRHLAIEIGRCAPDGRMPDAAAQIARELLG